MHTWSDANIKQKLKLWPSALGYGSKYDPNGVEILSHTIGSPWVDEGTTVTFATEFHWLTKGETADDIIFSFSSKIGLSVKGKVIERGGNNGDRYFLSKKRKVDLGSTGRTSLGLRYVIECVLRTKCMIYKWFWKQCCHCHSLPHHHPLAQSMVERWQQEWLQTRQMAQQETRYSSLMSSGHLNCCSSWMMSSQSFMMNVPSPFITAILWRQFKQELVKPLCMMWQYLHEISSQQGWKQRAFPRYHEDGICYGSVIIQGKSYSKDKCQHY